MNKKFEYASIRWVKDGDHNELTKDLNMWGRLGWEVISIRGPTFPTEKEKIIVYLKREITL